MMDVTPAMLRNCLLQARDTLAKRNPRREAEFMIKIAKRRGTSLEDAIRNLEIPDYTRVAWREAAGVDRSAIRGIEILVKLYADTQTEMRRLWV